MRVPNKTEDLNLSMFSMITVINESKSLTKHVSWGKKNKKLMVVNVIQIKSRITIYVGASVKTQKNTMCRKDIIFEVLLHVVVKMVNI